MNRRLFNSLVALLYISVAAVFGAIHHHEHSDSSGHDDDCAACQWQIHSSTDVPVYAVAPVILYVAFLPLSIPADAPGESPFQASSASRAPPLASA